MFCALRDCFFNSAIHNRACDALVHGFLDGFLNRLNRFGLSLFPRHCEYRLRCPVWHSWVRRLTSELILATVGSFEPGSFKPEISGLAPQNLLARDDVAERHDERLCAIGRRLAGLTLGNTRFLESRASVVRNTGAEEVPPWKPFSVWVHVPVRPLPRCQNTPLTLPTMASAVGKPLPPINVGLKMPAPASAFDASIVQPVMAPLPLVDKDIPLWKLATPVPVGGTASRLNGGTTGLFSKCQTEPLE